MQESEQIEDLIFLRVNMLFLHQKKAQSLNLWEESEEKREKNLEKKTPMLNEEVVGIGPFEVFQEQEEVLFSHP